MISALAIATVGLTGQMDIPLKAEYYLTTAGKPPLPIERLLEPAPGFTKLPGKFRARTHWTNALVAWLAGMTPQTRFDGQLLRVTPRKVVTAAFDLKGVALGEIWFPYMTRKGGSISPIELVLMPQSSSFSTKPSRALITPPDAVYKQMDYTLTLAGKKTNWADQIDRFKMVRESVGYVAEMDIMLYSHSQAPATPNTPQRRLAFRLESKNGPPFSFHILMDGAYVSSEAGSSKAHIRAVGLRFMRGD